MQLDMKTIGNRIKHRRKSLNLTLADIKNTAGISTGNLSDIENGKRLPAAPTLVLLGDSLQCTIDWILTGKSPESEHFSFSDSGEVKMLEMYRKLTEDDKDEINMIITYKFKRLIEKKQADVKMA